MLKNHETRCFQGFLHLGRVILGLSRGGFLASSRSGRGWHIPKKRLRRSAGEAGEIMESVQVAMIAGLPFTALRDAVLTHPTMAEGLIPLFKTLP